jgi:hypothetical protein
VYEYLLSSQQPQGESPWVVGTYLVLLSAGCLWAFWYNNSRN